MEQPNQQPNNLLVPLEVVQAQNACGKRPLSQEDMLQLLAVEISRTYTRDEKGYTA